MALVRWDPFKDLLTLQEEFNRFFEDQLAKRIGGEELASTSWVPPVDIYEDENNIVVKADLPGMDQKDIEVKVENNTLIIKGEKKFEDEEKKENYHRIERFYGAFQRAFTLPDTVDVEKIKANYKNGVLEITVPKKPEKKPKQIKVEVK